MQQSLKTGQLNDCLHLNSILFDNLQFQLVNLKNLDMCRPLKYYCQMSSCIAINKLGIQGIFVIFIFYLLYQNN